MTTQSMTPSDDDLFLAQLALDLEAAATPEARAALRQDALSQRPHLAGEIEAMFDLGQQLEDARPPVRGEDVPVLPGLKILCETASGGMGKIYKAWQDDLQRAVAVKVIRSDRISPANRERFLHEQKVLAQLHQTHIVPIFQAGTASTPDGEPVHYFVMQYIEGASLREVIQTARNYSTDHPDTNTPQLPELVKQTESGRQPDRKEPTGDAETAKGRTGRGGSPKLSREYFSSVARVMIDAALAVDHAHRAVVRLHDTEWVGVVHRDLKPSNIMLDAKGQCRVIDFGLAGYIGAVRQAGTAEMAAGTDITTTGGVLGTFHYMAPEQFDGRAEVRSDVWALGAITYELLTFQQAFPGQDRGEVEANVRRAAPTPPRVVVRNLPKDLAAICTKALQPKAGQRYATAAAFAEDLQRWLDLKPTIASDPWFGRRLLLWARRCTAVAVACLLGTCLVLGLLGGAWAQVRAAQEHEKTGIQRAKEQAEALQRQLRVQQLEFLYRAPHFTAWSKESWGLVTEVARTHQDVAIRNQAIASLTDFDAVEVIARHHFNAASVTFDATGTRVLFGQLKNQRGEPLLGARSLRLRAGAKEELKGLPSPGHGPVAFAPDGKTPWQIVPGAKPLTLEVRDLAADKVIESYTFPDAAGVNNAQHLTQILTHTRRGTYLAASALVQDKKSVVMVWDVNTGKLVQRFDHHAEVLALAPDGSLLAATGTDGKIVVWSLQTGKTVGNLGTGPLTVYGLAFGRDPLCRGTDPRRETANRWLLAAAEQGGVITIWEPHTQQVRAHCRGSLQDVHAVAFRADGAIVASAGRYAVHLWDTATGRRLLTLPASNFLTGVGFSRDGSHLVSTAQEAFGTPTGPFLWRLENGRGTRTLYGLSGQIEQVRWAGQAKVVAALAQNWQCGVWDLATDRLLRVFEVTPGISPDNAGLALSPDGKQVAVCAGQVAKLWESESGKELGSWALPPGYQDHLAFHPTKGLLLFRVETRDGKSDPFRSPPSEHPRVGRIRQLKAPDKVVAEWMLKETYRGVSDSVIAEDGTEWAIDGLAHDGKRQLKTVFNSLTGQATNKEYATFARKYGQDGLFVDSGVKVDLVQARTYFGGVGLFRESGKLPLVMLGIDAYQSNRRSTFNSARTHLAVGDVHGLVRVCDLPEILCRLKEVHLDWK